MLIYQYRCQKCGHQFERSQGIKDPPLKRCPKCAGEVHRVITGGSGFMFKGSSASPRFIGQHPAASPSCCGLTDPCEDPKRCCSR